MAILHRKNSSTNRNANNEIYGQFYRQHVYCAEDIVCLLCILRLVDYFISFIYLYFVVWYLFLLCVYKQKICQVRCVQTQSHMLRPHENNLF